MINKVFRDSKSRVEYDNLMRSGDWTTNGYWAILTSFEPNYLSELKTRTESKPKVQELIDSIDKNDLVPVRVTDELSLCGNNVIVKMVEKDDPSIVDTIVTIWVNVYFLTMFMNLKTASCSFFVEKKNHDRIVVKNSHDEIIGVIMTVRIHE